MLYANLDIDSTSFDFPILDNSYSPFQDSDSWSATSSPISSTSQVPKPATPKDNYPLAFSFRGSSSTHSLHKPKATKGERLEVRLSLSYTKKKQADASRNVARRTVHPKDGIERERKSTFKILKISARGCKREMTPSVPAWLTLGR
jgi:hypothetical protein